MVVGEHQAGAAVRGGLADNLPERKFRPGPVAGVARDMEAARPVVEMRDPQAFPARIAVGEATGEIGPRGGEAVELKRKFGTLIAHRRDLRAAQECAT